MGLGQITGLGTESLYWMEKSDWAHSYKPSPLYESHHHSKLWQTEVSAGHTLHHSESPWGDRDHSASCYTYWHHAHPTGAVINRETHKTDTTRGLGPAHVIRLFRALLSVAAFTLQCRPVWL